LARQAPISWEAAQTFLAVVERGSFSAAAAELGLGQPTVSRRIAQLEQVLSEQLFLRGKRGAEPTQAGQRLVPIARQMAKWAAEFTRTANGSEPDIEGVVTIAAPPGVAVEQLASFAQRLRLQHPDLRLNVLSGVAQVDLSRGGADIAIRTQAPFEPELMNAHCAQSQPIVAASPEYAKTLATPCDWADLDWITWSDSQRHVAPRPMLERVIAEFEPVFTADDYLVQKAAAQVGLGAFVMGIPRTETARRKRWRGEGLVEIEMRTRLPATEFFVVCAKSAQHVPRIRAVLGCLVAEISAMTAPQAGANDGVHRVT